ncbi:hypothetical protein [Palaeococcus ferrophilus]|uniref:hypothetical protein n=1 Tax=Palaeococcus ferrophilus TaxID=83868 RepID=UPI00064FB08B|nr:hypothetical protein [Palaeococcus ferrophilus]
MNRKSLGVLALMTILLLSLLAHDYREETCFSSASCVLHRIGAERGLVVVYRGYGEWRVITYENGTLSEIKATLKRSPVVKRITVEKKVVKTGLDYSPVSFTVNDIPTQNGYETAMILNVNGKVRALEGEEIPEIFDQTWDFADLLKKFNGVRFIFADRE